MHFKKLKVNLKDSLADQVKELGIKSYVNLDKITNLTEPQEELFDVEDGEEMLGKSPDECNEIFKKNGRRGLTLVESLAIIRKNPKTLKNHHVDCSNSRDAGGDVPCLVHWNDELDLGADHPGNVNSSYGSVSAGVSPLTLESSLEQRVSELEEFKKRVEKILII